MNVMIKAMLSSVLIIMSLVSFTNIIAGESDGFGSIEGDNNRIQLITYIKEMQSQDFKEVYASHNIFLENCAEVISNTLPFQSDYKQCEIKVKEVYSEFANL
tara:strand:- start:899 stop:1204 length:306 start_codon:yes stop_codon:yes gene_type:complete